MFIIYVTEFVKSGVGVWVYMCFYFVKKGLESFERVCVLKVFEGWDLEIHVLFYDGIFNDFSVWVSWPKSEKS